MKEVLHSIMLTGECNACFLSAISGHADLLIILFVSFISENINLSKVVFYSARK